VIRRQHDIRVECITCRKHECVREPDVALGAKRSGSLGYLTVDGMDANRQFRDQRFRAVKDSASASTWLDKSFGVGTGRKDEDVTPIGDHRRNRAVVLRIVSGTKPDEDAGIQDD
jgi:hypothetical protein